MFPDGVVSLIFLFSRWRRLKTITRVGLVTILLAVVLIVTSSTIETGIKGGVLGGLTLLLLGCITIPNYDDPIYQG